MYNPVATYRIQFNKSFTLADLERYFDYIKMLGTGCIYASPVFAAQPGSDHGYDVTDPGMINPEIGSLEDFFRLSKLLKESDVGWMQDIVPNHMAYHQDNKWIGDILEKGAESDFFFLFDTEYPVVSGKEKIMLPFLGNDPDYLIEHLEFRICIDKGNLALKYYDNLYPASFDSFRSFYTPHLDDAPECFRLIWKRHDLGSRVADKTFLNNEWELVKKEFDDSCSDPEMQVFADKLIKQANTDPGKIRNFVEMQNYEPCHWKETANRINYRRFFTVNGLICLKMEDKRVMEKHHSFLKELTFNDHIQGLRVDHIDGLRDPAGYLQELRAMAGQEKYIVVEKILERGEELPANWPVEGNTGYDFLAWVNNLMMQKSSYKKLERFYHRLTEDYTPAKEIVYGNKKMILRDHMNGELNNVFSLFQNLFLYAENQGIASYNDKKNISVDTLKAAIAEFMVSFPVYRIYPDNYPLGEEDRRKVEEIINEAVKNNAKIRNAIRLVGELLLKERKNDEIYNRLLAGFFGRMMQFTGPLTAKGVEDTSMYQYSCFIAGNEVGDSLSGHGMEAQIFHDLMIKRLGESPLSMNCTSTHDTKRGEDVRARLNVIGDLPDEWIKMVTEWIKMNGKLKPANIPNAAEEYFIYQTIAGTFPFDEDAGMEYITRVKEYVVKALREAKQSTSWENPDQLYENTVCNFTEAILDKGNIFLSSFIPFHRKLAWRGVVNSLCQLAIKCLAPGVPDIYRGTELWDLTMVDPDNRRKVDYDFLQKNLKEILIRWKKVPSETINDLFRRAGDGRIKLLLTGILLNERKANPDLFLFGDYFPVHSQGKHSRNIFGFARHHKGRWLLCILPMHTGGLSGKNEGEHFTSIKWSDTRVLLPEGSPREWYDILSDRTLRVDDQIKAGELFKEFPVVILKGKMEKSRRKAGILLHLTSLPGIYGTGDMGKEAYRFADLLGRTFQSYWQTLPLTPVTKTQSWSPYSSPSAFAGNTILIDPVQLYKEGLIAQADLEIIKFTNKDRVNYEKAGKFREEVLEKAWKTLANDTSHYLYSDFKKFCAKESYWLDDYSLFMAYKRHYGKKEWGKWPGNEKRRDQKTMKTACYEFAGIIRVEKFKQFIFDRQWKKLKSYVNNKKIRMFGDIPLYVSYDSADVWANQDYFNLDIHGRMETIAGVPPDYFDRNGQLWNMPVFNWERMKEDGYDWWIKRLTRNLELFDLLRLDHFRAFSAFWEVPSQEKTSVNGKWRAGPGSDFFKAVKAQFPSMPFVAEDLGDIDQNVYDLKNEFQLPGMQVLQFTFDNEMASNIHTPHNHLFNSLVYTGTHDNNTIRGWYDKEVDRGGKLRLQEYIGRKINASALHREMIRLAFASPAKLTIIPVQDYIGLGREARMNTPSTSKGNWMWKMKKDGIDGGTEEMIRKFTVMYNRK